MTAAARYRAACAALDIPPGKGLGGLWAWSAEPDFADPATLGCLTATVREVLGDPRAFVRPSLTGWAVLPGDPCRIGMAGHGPTEAEALIAALEAAAARGGQP